MDEYWAANTLRWWITNATSVMTQAGYAPGGVGVDMLRAHEAQTVAVVHRMMGGSPPTLIVKSRGGSGNVFELAAGVDLIKYALGKLETQAETRKNLGSTAPVMSADALHQLVWGAAEKYWASGHHGQAVQRAATFLNAHVQDLTGRHDLSDVQLMAQVFSAAAPEPGKPRLRWPGNESDLTVKAMRSGILNFSQGCFMAIRNPATHGTDELPQQVCLEQLATLSTLARWIDACELVGELGHM